eukprot:g3213.t1
MIKKKSVVDVGAGVELQATSAKKIVATKETDALVTSSTPLPPGDHPFDKASQVTREKEASSTGDITTSSNVAAASAENDGENEKVKVHRVKSLPRRQSSFVGQNTIKTLSEISSFSTSDLAKLHSRFHGISHHTTVSPNDFRLALGIFGMTSDSILSQRLFSVFDKGGDGQLSFADYAMGLNIMMKGTVEEKLRMSFQIMDISGNDFVSFDEFNAILQSMARTYSGIMGESLKSAGIPKDEVDIMFSVFRKNHMGEVSLDDYVRGIKEHPDLLSSFGRSKKHSSLLTLLQIKNTNLSNEVAQYKQALAEASGHIEELRRRVKKLADDAASEEAVGGEEKGVDAIRSSATELTEYMKSSLEQIKALAVAGAATRTTSSSVHEAAAKIANDDDDDDDGGGGGGLSLQHVAARHSRNNSSSSIESHDTTSSLDTTYAVFLAGAGLGLETMNGRVTRVADDDTAANGVRVGDQIIAIGSINVGNVGTNIDKRIRTILRNSPKRPIRVRFARAQHLTSIDFASGDKEKILQNRLLSKDIGDMIFFGHHDWELVMKLMQGLQLSVNRASQEVVREVTSYDFNVKEKYTLRRTTHAAHASGSSAKSTANIERTVRDLDKLLEGHCRFVDYAPYVFRQLREMWGISGDDYVNSIGPAKMLTNLVLGSLTSLSQLGTEGKSGSFFYFTSDAKFMVKTISKTEHSLLRSILKDYYYYLVKNPDSMLCRIVGCHQMRFGKHSKFGAEKMYFIVMQNCFQTDVAMHHRFDLKGSWVGRYVGKSAWKKMGACLKDQDFREMGLRIDVGPKRKKRLLQIIEADSLFLSKHSIIDYSLLLGVHKNSKTVAMGLRRRASTSPDNFVSSASIMSASSTPAAATPFYTIDDGGLNSVDGSMTFFFGIIDILTLFNTKKRWERRFKGIYLDIKGVSVQPPKQYSKRFVSFLRYVLE